MTAQGKVSASKVEAGQRIIVQFGLGGVIFPSTKKTGSDVEIVRVTGKTFREAQGPHEARGKYVIETSAGTFEATAIQTMILAPEDAAGVKRAHVEALAAAADYATTEGPAPRPTTPAPAPAPAPAPTDAAPLAWRTLAAGRYMTTDEQYMIVRDPNANDDNRWSLRRPGKGVISAHRLLKSAKSRAASIAASAAAAASGPARPVPMLGDVHADALIDNRRFDRFAAQNRRAGHPELFERGRRVAVSSLSRGGIPFDLRPGRVTAVVRGTMHVALDTGGTTMVMRGTYVEALADQPVECGAELRTFPFGYCTRPSGHLLSDGLGHDRPAAIQRQPEQQHAQGPDEPAPMQYGPIDKAAILAKPIDSLLHSGAYTPQPEQQHPQGPEQPADLSTPALRPTPVDAIAAHYRETRQWPSASQIVGRGADLDELHHAEARGEVERFDAFTRDGAAFQLPEPDAGRAHAVDDIVTVDPMRESRQFTVIAVDDIDGLLVRVMPRDQIHVDDTPRWVSAEYTHRVPAALILPVADDEQDEPECEGHESLAGGSMGETVYCDGTCVQRGPGVPVFVDPWAGNATPDPGPQFTRGDEVVKRSGGEVYTVVRVAPIKSGRGRQQFWREGSAIALHSDEYKLVRHACLPPETIADMIRPAMPGQYRDVLTYLLTPHGFAPPAGIDVKVPDDANPEPFLIHDPTGIAVGVHERHVRLSYPAEHAGEGDGHIGTAYADLEYGTSFETVADLAVGLSLRLRPPARLDTAEPLSPQAQALLAAGRITEPPLTQAQVGGVECGAEFTTSVRLETRFRCARPPHGDDVFGHSVMRYPIGAPRPEGTPAAPVDELLDAGGFLGCGCHGSAREHSCGPAAPEVFDPAVEV